MLAPSLLPGFLFSQSFVPGINRIICRWVALAVCVIGPQAAHAQFAAEDQVRLRKDEPLYFKDGVFRTGKAGETFQVLMYDAAHGRVFLGAIGSDGKTFALNCSDQALEPMPKDYWALVRQGIRTMQQTDMAGARALFVRASTAEQIEKTAFNLALHCEALDKARADLAAARAFAQRTQVEVTRILKNAQVTDRPNRLLGGNDNQIRAEEMRTTAMKLKEQAEQSIRQAETALAEAVTAANSTADALLSSGSLSLGLPMSDSVASFAAKFLPAAQPPARLSEIDRATITRRINTASDAVARAVAFVDARQLHGALRAIGVGLEAEPGRGELKKLRIETELRLSKVATLLALATSLKDQGRLDDSLAQVTKAEALCSDDDGLRTFAQDLRGALARR